MGYTQLVCFREFIRLIERSFLSFSTRDVVRLRGELCFVTRVPTARADGRNCFGVVEAGSDRALKDKL